MTTLRQEIEREGPLDYRRAAQYISDVALQLTELHNRGVVHRDLRPSVLILDKADRVKLQPSNPWQVETFIGSDSPIDENWTFEMANYLAPEQVLNVDTVDARSDIYSLGCTFYFLLTGHPPFPGGSIAERLLKHQVATASSITEERPNAPLSLVDLCERMMSKKPEQRPQAAAEVSSALNAWLAEYDAG